MVDDAEVLLSLSRFDTTLFGLEEEIERKPRALKAELERAEKAEKTLAEAREALKDMQRLVDRRNLDLRSAEEHEKKLQGQLLTLRNNDDYKAMLRQIEQEKARIGELEVKVLEGLEILDGARARIPEREKALAAERTALEAKRRIVEGEVAELTARKAAEEARWRGLRERLSADLKVQYDRVRAKHRGRSVVPVTEDGHCGGCHVSLTVNIVNAIHAGNVRTCQNCQRLLIFRA